MIGQDHAMAAGRQTATVPASLRGARLDQALARLFADYSRARIQEWIRRGLVTVDGRPPRAAERVHGGERIDLRVPDEPLDPWRAEPLDLAVVHADAGLLVVDKPAGLVVHPGAGNREGTLVNALLHHFPELATVPRAGLVHRLDKDTSGLLAVARHLGAHRRLVAALKERSVSREYEAIVTGRVVAGGCVEAPIGRHPTRRTRMAVTGGGRPARTHYRVLQRFRAHTRLALALDTGRTHQIRVHMAHIGHPVVGDPAYGRRAPTGDDALAAALGAFRRQALHACRLALAHPDTGEALRFESPLPADMAALLEALERDAR